MPKRWITATVRNWAHDNAVDLWDVMIAAVVIGGLGLVGLILQDIRFGLVLAGLGVLSLAMSSADWILRPPAIPIVWVILVSLHPFDIEYVAFYGLVPELVAGLLITLVVEQRLVPQGSSLGQASPYDALAVLALICSAGFALNAVAAGETTTASDSVVVAGLVVGALDVLIGFARPSEDSPLSTLRRERRFERLAREREETPDGTA